MARRRQVVVVGLGRFGSALAETLSEIGHEVLAIDINHKPVQEISDVVTHAVQGDGTDAETLSDVGAGEFDTGIVAVGDIEQSILITVQLKRLGVPYVIAKAKEELHGTILEKIGADRIVYPEREVGERLAHSFIMPNVVDYMSLGPDYGISKLEPPAQFIGRSVGELGLGDRYHVALMMIQRSAQVVINPGPDERIQGQDLLVIAGLDDAVERFRST
ncbi:MAG: TrkA family potassium uptake protein [Dehalococcoidia bacterium]